jgi:hypothetical protein
MLPGGYGIARHILAYLGWPGTSASSPARRVSFSELLGSGLLARRPSLQPAIGLRRMIGI